MPGLSINSKQIQIYLTARANGCTQETSAAKGGEGRGNMNFNCATPKESSLPRWDSIFEDTGSELGSEKHQLESF